MTYSEKEVGEPTRGLPPIQHLYVKEASSYAKLMILGVVAQAVAMGPEVRAHPLWPITFRHQK